MAAPTSQRMPPSPSPRTVRLDSSASSSGAPPPLVPLLAQQPAQSSGLAASSAALAARLVPTAQVAALALGTAQLLPREATVPAPAGSYRSWLHSSSGLARPESLAPIPSTAYSRSAPSNVRADARRLVSLRQYDQRLHEARVEAAKALPLSVSTRLQQQSSPQGSAPGQSPNRAVATMSSGPGDNPVAGALTSGAVNGGSSAAASLGRRSSMTVSLGPVTLQSASAASPAIAAIGGGSSAPLASSNLDLDDEEDDDEDELLQQPSPLAALLRINPRMKKRGLFYPVAAMAAANLSDEQHSNSNSAATASAAIPAAPTLSAAITTAAPPPPPPVLNHFRLPSATAEAVERVYASVVAPPVWPPSLAPPPPRPPSPPPTPGSAEATLALRKKLGLNKDGTGYRKHRISKGPLALAAAAAGPATNKKDGKEAQAASKDSNNGGKSKAKRASTGLSSAMKQQLQQSHHQKRGSSGLGSATERAPSTNAAASHAARLSIDSSSPVPSTEGDGEATSDEDGSETETVAADPFSFVPPFARSSVPFPRRSRFASSSSSFSSQAQQQQQTQSGLRRTSPFVSLPSMQQQQQQHHASIDQTPMQQIVCAEQRAHVGSDGLLVCGVRELRDEFVLQRASAIRLPPQHRLSQQPQRSPVHLFDEKRSDWLPPATNGSSGQNGIINDNQSFVFGAVTRVYPPSPAIPPAATRSAAAFAAPSALMTSPAAPGVSPLTRGVANVPTMLLAEQHQLSSLLQEQSLLRQQRSPRGGVRHNRTMPDEPASREPAHTATSSSQFGPSDPSFSSPLRNGLNRASPASPLLPDFAAPGDDPDAPLFHFHPSPLRGAAVAGNGLPARNRLDLEPPAFRTPTKQHPQLQQQQQQHVTTIMPRSYAANGSTARSPTENTLAVLSSPHSALAFSQLRERLHS